MCCDVDSLYDIKSTEINAGYSLWMTSNWSSMMKCGLSFSHNTLYSNIPKTIHTFKNRSISMKMKSSVLRIEKHVTRMNIGGKKTGTD